MAETDATERDGATEQNAAEGREGSATLPALDYSGWERVLCVVAHPDDTEYGLSAAVHMWARAGIEVGYLLLTAGEAGMKRPPEEAGPLRSREQRAACDAVGVGRLTILDHPDGHLEPTLAMRRDIAREIRSFRPDVVVAQTFDVEAPWGLNQADHRAVGLATIDAARDAGNRWVFRDLAEEEGLDPWEADLLAVAQPSDPTHGVAVDDDAIAAAVRSLDCHEAYLADLPGHPAPADFIPQALRGAGPLMGAAAGVTFRVHELGGVAKTED